MVPAVLLAIVVASSPARAQMSVDQAVVTFDTYVSQYNIITGQDTTLTGTHTDGAVATSR
ncbi:MAG: hypothetical protein J6386_07230 [Candidatus Synoicihabitans palmerolidicus]|nr:hypothetical protein [Candidatus Synoicihabitans palmerolidicus]